MALLPRADRRPYAMLGQRSTRGRTELTPRIHAFLANLTPPFLEAPASGRRLRFSPLPAAYDVEYDGLAAPTPERIHRTKRQDVMHLDRRTFGRVLIGGIASAAIGRPATIVHAATPIPLADNVVLVHGLFADGSSWSEVIPLLQSHGLTVTSVQNPLTTLDEAVAATRKVLKRQTGRTVLVGHSFAGMIVTEVGLDENVSALVYVAARAPDAGEDYTALARRFAPPPASAGIVFDGDEGRLTEQAFLHDFAGDLPPARARALYAVQEPFQKGLLAGRTTKAAWRSKPRFYAVSTMDRTIDPGLQRFMAKRMNARTIELPSSHLSLISHPKEIAALILQACGR